MTEKELMLNNYVDSFINEVNILEQNNIASMRLREKLEAEILNLSELCTGKREELDIAQHAIDIIRQVSDEAVAQAYKFLEQSLNSALERMFANTTRKIKLVEKTRAGMYPQLELELTVKNGYKRSLKSDSGHGIAQIVSILSILSLIVLTNSRRILIMDEVLSGLSVRNREIITDIMWTFSEIGFQFVVNDHGFVPRGSYVYHLEMNGDVSSVKEEYLEKTGVYLNGNNFISEDYIEENTEVFNSNIVVTSDNKLGYQKIGEEEQVEAI